MWITIFINEYVTLKYISPKIYAWLPNFKIKKPIFVQQLDYDDKT